MPPLEQQLELLPPPPPLPGEIPAELIFDDAPLEPLLYGGAPVPPTPANALELWRLNLDRSPACARAIATTVAKNPGELAAPDRPVAEACLRAALAAEPPLDPLQLARCHAGLAELLKAGGHPDEVEHCCREAFQLLEAAAGLAHDDTQAAGLTLVRLLRETDREEQADRLSIRLRAAMLGDGADEFDLLEHRQLALEMFQAAQYAEAVALYRRLVGRAFELPSTWCHLARVHLMTDDIAGVRAAVAQAVCHQAGAPAYVVCRIHFLQALLHSLAGEPWTEPLRQIKTVLAQSYAHMDWIMQPVLDRWQPQLPPATHDLLAKVAAALADDSQLPELEALDAWKNLVADTPAEPLPAADSTEDVPF